jgi:predicted nucleotidyltransferase component of viral defense system
MSELIEHEQGYQTEAQRELLLKIFSYPFSQGNLFITGGTALSVFYAAHRLSKDIDLFLLRKENLLEAVRIFRDFGTILTTISESPTFCSYIFEKGVKVDFVYDSFSASSEKETTRVEGISINVDSLENITTNKICAAVSRAEPKDIIDLTWLFTHRFHPETEFIQFFTRASEREGLLDDLLFVKGVFSHISENPDMILNSVKGGLLIEFEKHDVSRIFRIFEDSIDGQILRGQFDPGKP